MQTQSRDNTTITFLDTGDIKEINSFDFMINQLEGNTLDGSLNQLYLRKKTKDGYHYAPMVGSNSLSTFYSSQDQQTWKGDFEEINYQVDFKLATNNQWFWRVLLSGKGQVDIIYGQDLGLANKTTVTANEAYVSQYIDHHVTKSKDKLVITSRQNQPQNGKFPAISQGCFQKTVGFSTDGYQFFDRKYKLTNQPECLKKECLENEVYQYEFAFVALQTEQITLGDEVAEIVFYSSVKENQQEEVTEPVSIETELIETYRSLTFGHPPKVTRGYKKIGRPLVGSELSEATIKTWFPEQKEVEVVDNQTYSFFTKEGHHVVLQKKELEMERAHGHILLSGMDLKVDQPLLSTTVYMYGIFNSQVVLGNTTMNKLMSNSRNSLNVMKRSGQRIYLLVDEEWRLLTMPSAFEMGLNSATWYYQLPEELIQVRTYTLPDTREVRLEVKGEKSYSWVVTNHLLMGPEEKATYKVSRQCNELKITGENSPTEEYYPKLTYYIESDNAFELTNDGQLFTRSADLLVMTFNDTTGFSLTIHGSLSGENEKENDLVTFDEAQEEYQDFIDQLIHRFELRHDSLSMDKINLLTRWYTHNMLVHYLSPHGLEQFGGAAWGTRDVSQGPTEFFLAVNRPDVVVSIIEHLFENQFIEDGHWPQWFMFDRYEEQKATESHGDVIVWPLKVVADYLEQTGDMTILQKEIPYTSYADFHKTRERYPLMDHLQKEITYITSHFLPGTYLSCYGDGDWDDTLQPYDNRLKEQMASSWTVALTYQVIKKLGMLLKKYAPDYSDYLNELAEKIKKDFQKFMLKDETIPGFIYMENVNEVEPIIHPKDTKTGIKYRLLPMTRSMIAEILSPEEVVHHLRIIKSHLLFPDGVRLMDRPAAYHGGVSTNFKRAEQAANFGREIGLQYVHAHIRYTEAMAKIGQRDQTWHALKTINPIKIRENVHNAELRQANAYFSSSDGNFRTRYESQENFGKLKNGEVGVKGGWRIYSSGPGIYLNQLITTVLGIRIKEETLVFDPVLPKELEGLELRYQLLGKNITIKFYPEAPAKVTIDGKAVSFDLEENPYREGGLILKKKEILSSLEENSVIEIYH